MHGRCCRAVDLLPYRIIGIFMYRYEVRVSMSCRINNAGTPSIQLLHPICQTRLMGGLVIQMT